MNYNDFILQERANSESNWDQLTCPSGLIPDGTHYSLVSHVIMTYMATRRQIKQGVYAGGFSIGVILFLGLLVFLITRPEPFQPLRPIEELASIRPISVEQVSIIKHARSVDLVAQLRNPNPRAGVPNYPVSFILLDSDSNEIERRVEQAYILPGSLNYIIALNVSTDSQTIGTVKLELPQEPGFVALPANIDSPSFNTFPRSRVGKEIGAEFFEEQKGIVVNTSTFDFQSVEITAVALNAADQVIGTGKTFIGELKVGEQREYTVQWPAPEGQTVRVVAIPTTNIFLEENIIRVIGEPGSLR